MCARTNTPKSGVEGALQAPEFVGEKEPLATLPRGVTLEAPLSRLFPCRVPALCRAKFLLGSLFVKLLLATLTSGLDLLQHSSLPKRKRPGVNLPGPIGALLEFLSPGAEPNSTSTGDLQAQWDSYANGNPHSKFLRCRWGLDGTHYDVTRSGKATITPHPLFSAPPV
jgi:hypothetical protein